MNCGAESQFFVYNRFVAFHFEISSKWQKMRKSPFPVGKTQNPTIPLIQSIPYTIFPFPRYHPFHQKRCCTMI